MCELRIRNCESVRLQVLIERLRTGLKASAASVDFDRLTSRRRRSRAMAYVPFRVTGSVSPNIAWTGKPTLLSQIRTGLFDCISSFL